MYSTFFGSAGDLNDVSHVRGQLGKERYLDHAPDPSAYALDQVRILAAGEAHPTLAHAVRARKVQLQSVSPGLFAQPSEGLPVLFRKRGHDARDQDLQRKHITWSQKKKKIKKKGDSLMRNDKKRAKERGTWNLKKKKK